MSKSTTTIPQLQVGNTTIYTQNQHFAQGYRHGYERFSARYANKPVFDWEVYTFILSNMINNRDHRLWNTGYVLGWIVALIENQPGAPRQAGRNTSDEKTS